MSDFSISFGFTYSSIFFNIFAFNVWCLINIIIMQAQLPNLCKKLIKQFNCKQIFVNLLRNYLIRLIAVRPTANCLHAGLYSSVGNVHIFGVG